MPFHLKEETSRKWLTVAIFRKWQDSSVALWIEIAVILKLRHSLEIWYGFVGLVWYVRGGSQMTTEFILEEISIMDYNGLS